MSTAGRKLLSSLVHTGDLQAYIKMGLQPYLFKETEGDLFFLIRSHISKYGKIPKQSTIEEVAGFEDAIVDAPEPPKFYLDELERRHLHNTLKSTVQEASMLLTTKHAEAALDVLLKATGIVMARQRRNSLYDFREAESIIHQAYVAQKTMGNEMGLPYGWEYLDEMSGGARAGDFVTFVGRPQAGKTFKMLYTAHHAWKAGRVPLFASLEMMALIITQRLVALHSKKKLTDLMKAELSTKAFNAMMNDLHALQHKPNPLWVVDGNMANTVDDLVMFCHQLNPSALYVDGAYLLDHPDKKMSKWDKQAENARLLKQKVATDLGIPVIASYQLSKSSAKDKKKSKHGQADGMEDVYGSDEMAQLSSVMLGLFDNEDSIEAKKTRRVKLLKGRNGETGEFVINWDFSTKMDFSQHKTEKPEDVQMDFMG